MTFQAITKMQQKSETCSLSKGLRPLPPHHRQQTACCRQGFALLSDEPQETSKSFDSSFASFTGFVRDPPGFPVILRPGTCSEPRRHRTFLFSWPANFVTQWVWGQGPEALKAQPVACRPAAKSQPVAGRPAAGSSGAARTPELDGRRPWRCDARPCNSRAAPIRHVLFLATLTSATHVEARPGGLWDGPPDLNRLESIWVFRSEAVCTGNTLVSGRNLDHGESGYVNLKTLMP